MDIFQRNIAQTMSQPVCHSSPMQTRKTDKVKKKKKIFARIRTTYYFLFVYIVRSYYFVAAFKNRPETCIHLHVHIALRMREKEQRTVKTCLLTFLLRGKFIHPQQDRCSIFYPCTWNFPSRTRLYSTNTFDPFGDKQIVVVALRVVFLE